MVNDANAIQVAILTKQHFWTKYMHKEIPIKELENISQKWGIRTTSIQLLKRHKHFVYSIEAIDGSYILRLDYDNSVSLDLLNSQLYFANYLHQKNLTVPRQLVSKNSNLIEKIYINEICYLASIQKKIKYPQITHSDFQNKKTVEALGNTLGILHQVSKEYCPPQQFRTCPKHTEKLDNAIKDNTNQAILDQVNSAKQRLHEIPINKDTYGLIHSDLHPGNLLLKDGKIAILDFDLCCYAWYIYDLAIPLIYVDKKLQELFLDSYRQQTNLNSDLMKYIPLCQAVFTEFTKHLKIEKT